MEMAGIWRPKSMTEWTPTAIDAPMPMVANRDGRCRWLPSPRAHSATGIAIDAANACGIKKGNDLVVNSFVKFFPRRVNIIFPLTRINMIVELTIVAVIADATWVTRAFIGIISVDINYVHRPLGFWIGYG